MTYYLLSADQGLSSSILKKTKATASKALHLKSFTFYILEFGYMVGS